jgi:hypothetical protein
MHGAALKGEWPERLEALLSLRGEDMKPHDPGLDQGEFGEVGEGTSIPLSKLC